MSYSELVASAPPGAGEFVVADLGRLPPGVVSARAAQMPAEERRLYDAGDREAARRLVKALFWELVYWLRPQLWEALSQAEPIHPAILERLPADGNRVLEVGAGSGRLTAHLAPRARMLIAVEPVAPLREILLEKLPDVAVLDAVAADIPVTDRWADLTVACASLGPEDGPFLEMARCTREGGTLALVSPRNPDWFAAHGWNRLSFDPSEVTIPDHDPALEAFFGPLDPPHELLLMVV